MATTCSDVVARSAGYSVQSDSTLTQNSSEMLAKINAFQNEIFSRVAADNRFFAASASLTSTSGPPTRSIDLSATTNLERVFLVLQSDGTTVRPVDVEDTAAEIAPRYYILGKTMYEVETDWGGSPPGTGTATFTVWYAFTANQIDPSGDLSQTLTLPDQHADLVSIRLASYLAGKDVGRDPTEVQRLDALYESRLGVVLDSLSHYAGAVRRRFVSPYPFPGGSS